MGRQTIPSPVKDKTGTQRQSGVAAVSSYVPQQTEGGPSMQCYVCAKAGKQTEAVGICIVCGMGLCMDHALREDVDFWEGGYPFPNKKSKKKLPRILCAECKQVLEQVVG
jgi:hypothetical protein